MKWRVYLHDVVALVLGFVLAIYVKYQVGELMTQIEDYSAQFEAMNISENSLVALVEFEQVVQGFSELVYLAYFLVMIVLPLGLYLFFVLSQGLNFSLILKNKFNLQYFLKLFFVCLPLFALSVFLLNQIFMLLVFYFSSWLDLLLLLLYLFVIFVCGFVGVSLGVLFVKKNVVKSFKRFWLLLKERFLGLFLPYLGMFVTFLVMLLLLGVLFVRSITWSFFGYTWVFMVVCVFALVVLINWFRVKFVNAIYNVK